MARWRARRPRGLRGSGLRDRLRFDGHDAGGDPLTALASAGSAGGASAWRPAPRSDRSASTTLSQACAASAAWRWPLSAGGQVRRQRDRQRRGVDGSAHPENRVEQRRDRLAAVAESLDAAAGSNLDQRLVLRAPVSASTPATAIRSSEASARSKRLAGSVASRSQGLSVRAARAPPRRAGRAPRPMAARRRQKAKSSSMTPTTGASPAVKRRRLGQPAVPHRGGGGRRGHRRRPSGNEAESIEQQVEPRPPARRSTSPGR